MKIKSILLSILLIGLSACASTATKSHDSLQLMDGSYVFLHEGRAVRFTDNTGKEVNIKKTGMLELANGNFIYIKQDGTVNNLESDYHSDSHQSHTQSSKSSSGGGHSH